MTFVHGYLLSGLVLAGVPVVLHLLMRQKPKRLPFPAFRFLKQKQAVNRRKVRLQHLFLLALRVLAVAALCLALARPRVFSERASVDAGWPVAVVLLFDTSPSMDYLVGGASRLDDARARARELLAELNKDSEVAVLDAGEDEAPAPLEGDAFLTPAQALARLDGLATRPGSGAVNRGLKAAYDLAARVAARPEPPPCLVYVFSDRTRAAWDPSPSARPAPPEGLSVSFVDVGVEAPNDLAISRVEVDPPVVAPGGRFEVRVTVRGAGGRHEGAVSLTLDGGTGPARALEPRPFELTAGQSSAVVTFEAVAPPVGDEAAGDVPFQVSARLAAADNLAFNNARRATYLVRAGRRLLTITEGPAKPQPWADAVVALSLRDDYRTREQAEAMAPNELARYRVVVLYEVPRPGEALLKKLADFVRGGGGLAVVPPGDELTDPDRAEFNRLAADLLPAPLAGLSPATEAGVAWAPFRADHPVSEFLGRAAGDADPVARRLWRTGPLAPRAVAVAHYRDRENSVALAERDVGAGRVVLFTTPLDARPLDPRRPTVGWHNYWQSFFGVVLIDRVCRRLAGEADAADPNHLCGRAPLVTLPAPPAPPYTVQGPGLAAAEAELTAGPAGVAQAVPQAVQPGNYLVLDGAGRRVAGFSLEVPPEESALGRVDAAEIEAVLGAGSVLQPGRGARLTDAVRGNRPPPVELLPLLMMALLAVLCAESLLSSRFGARRPAGRRRP